MCCVKKEQKATQTAAVDQAYVANLADLDPTDPRVSTAPWDLKD